MPSETSRRTTRRMKVMWNAALRCGDTTSDCQVLDISAGGSRIRLAEPLPVRSEVVLVVDRVGRVPGQIIWRRGNYAGIQFLEDRQTVQERLCRVVPQLALHPELAV